MINIENIDVYGFETAIRGMRNPMNSWKKSDTWVETDCETCCSECEGCEVTNEGCVFIGDDDMKLMKSLFKGGTEHRKYMRMINVTMDITAPLYWWKEFDTYKIGTVANSCSTMHKIHAKEFTLDDFSHEHLLDNRKREHESEFVCFDGEYCYTGKDVMAEVIVPTLNQFRDKFLETKDKRYWWQMIQLLPSSYNQRRTVQMNYEVAVNIIRQRKNHKLDEWHVMVDELLNLPYMKEIMGVEHEIN